MALPHIVLGVDKDASMEEITSAFRRLAQLHHPDRNGGSYERFLEVKQAYDALRAKHAAVGPFDDLIDAAARENKA